MPSVRVKRGRERPYLPMQDGQNAVEPTPRSGTLEVPAHVSSGAGRPRSGTITSYFSAASGAATGAESVAMRSPQAQSFAAPGSVGSSRPTSPVGVRGSVVGSHCLRNSNGRTRLRKQDPRLRNTGQGISGDRRSIDRRSLGSYGGDPQPVDVRLSEEDLDGQVGSALSLPRGERGLDYSDHHHDEIVDHLDVIGTFGCTRRVP